MKVEEKFFREIYRQICLLKDSALAANFLDLFDTNPNEKIDGLLTYGYIDEIAGFTFSILGGAMIRGNQLKIFPINYKSSAIVRRSDADSAEIKILTNEYALAFRDRMAMIDDAHAVNPSKEQTRSITNLDEFRHPNYPDDVVVYFFAQEQSPELLWVRCQDINENILSGELLNEPKQNLNCHMGDKIKFGVAQVNGKNILLHLPN